MTNKFYSKKRYGNDRGLSCCFRQWRSTHSHCSLLHGYSIGVEVIFECDTLDERNWVMDFGGLKDFKKWLEYMFDHTLVIAEDDPELELLKTLSNKGVADIRVVPAVGCERFAELALNKMQEILEQSRESNTLLNPTVRVKSVEVFEHDANSAIVEAGEAEVKESKEGLSSFAKSCEYALDGFDSDIAEEALKRFKAKKEITIREISPGLTIKEAADKRKNEKKS